MLLYHIISVLSTPNSEKNYLQPKMQMAKADINDVAAFSNALRGKCLSNCHFPPNSAKETPTTPLFPHMGYKPTPLLGYGSVAANSNNKAQDI
jgi:hypothetical protein